MDETDRTTEFHPDRWCEELGQRLDAFSSSVWPSFSYDFPEEMLSPNFSLVPDAREWARRRYRILGEMAQHDPGAAEAFDRASLRYADNDIVVVIAALREHPILRHALDRGDPDPHEAVEFLVPFVRAFRIEMRTLASQLTRLTFKTNGVDAARLLNQFLAEGEARSLRGREINLILGLRSARRVDIGEGVFLAPFQEVEALYGLHPATRDDTLDERPSFTGSRHRLLRESPEYVTALVREFTWGPAIVSIPESSGPSNLPVVQLPDSAQEYLFPPLEDNERINDFLTITMGAHQQDGGQYVPVDRWLTDISVSYRFSRDLDSGSASDWRGPVRDFSEDKVQTFLEMIERRAGYKENREQLDSAVRQLATLHSRAGRSRITDRILDAATALEVLYGLNGPEITYKLRVRAGFFLGKGSEERQEIFRKVGRFYEARSAAVHGGTRRRRRQLDPAEALSDGIAIAQDTLLAVLRLGHTPDWDRMVMSAGENLDPPST